MVHQQFHHRSRTISVRNCFRIQTYLNFYSKLHYTLFRWSKRFYIYTFLFTIIITAYVSYNIEFGVLYNLRHMKPETPSIINYRQKLISKQKKEQSDAYNWLQQLYEQSSTNKLFTNNQSTFYNYINTSVSTSSDYYLLNYNKTTTTKVTQSDMIVITILYSSNGNDRQEGKFYIGQVLKTLLEQYDDPRIIVTICENSHYNDEQLQHIGDEIKLIRKLVPVYIVNAQAIHTHSLNIELNEYEREKQAHLKCLKANFESFTSSDYVLLLQDDAKPIDKIFLNTLLYLIDQRFKQWKEKPAFLKIYHPRWLIDYAKHPSVYIIVQLLAMSLLLTFIVYTFLHYHYYPTPIVDDTQMIKSNAYEKDLKLLCRFVCSNENINYFLFYFLLIISVLFLLNHSNISWPWRRLHPSLYSIYDAPSCCIPGVIYFRQTYSYVHDYLYQTQCKESYAIDTVLDNLPEHYDYTLKTLLLEPNLVHHIGLYSRLRQSYINPYLID